MTRPCEPVLNAPWRVYVMDVFDVVRLVRSGISPNDMKRTMRMFLDDQRRLFHGDESEPLASGWLVESHAEHGPQGAIRLGDLVPPTTLFHEPEIHPSKPTESRDALVFWSETAADGGAWVRMAPYRTRFLHFVPVAIEECVPQWRATRQSTAAIHATEYLCKYAEARRAMGDAGVIEIKGVGDLSVAGEREARRAEIERLQASLRDLLVQCDAALEHLSRTFPRLGP